MKRLAVMILAAASAAIFAGCASTHARDAQLDLKPKTAALEAQDVRRTVERMVDSMLADSTLNAAIGGQRPVLDVTSVKNRTTLHLDTKMLTDSIRTRLIRSRKFRFMDRSTAADDQQFMNDQTLNGMTDPTKAVRPGQQSAVQMYLYGDLYEVRNHVDDVTDRYYKFTLNLKDLRTGEIVWTDEQEIRKEEVRNVMGF